MLAATNAQIVAMGWMYVPFVVLCTSVMLAIALVVNNIQRCYPLYWWTEGEIGVRAKVVDVEKGQRGRSGTVNSTESERTLRNGSEGGVEEDRSYVCDSGPVVVVTGHSIDLPPMLDVTAEELEVLKRMQTRLGAMVAGDLHLPA